METASRPVTYLSDLVAKEIRVLLVRRDMRQTELAAKLGVSEMWLSRRLRGAQPLDLNDLQRIAAVLDVEVTDLLPRRDEGRVLPTGGQHADDKGRGITIRKFGVAERPRPNGHPKRSQPHPSTRRPGRVIAAHATL